jgi:hypothetical protein
MNRRGFLGGLVALAAPAIIRTPGLLMPVRVIVSAPRDYLLVPPELYEAAVRLWEGSKVRAGFGIYSDGAVAARNWAIVGPGDPLLDEAIERREQLDAMRAMEREIEASFARARS